MGRKKGTYDDTFAPLLLVSIIMFVLLTFLVYDLFIENWFLHKILALLFFASGIWTMFIAFDIVGMSFETFLGGILPDFIRISFGL